MNEAFIRVGRIEFCATNRDDYLIAKMILERGELGSAGSKAGPAADLSLTITDSMDRMRVLEPICTPITDGMLDAVPPGGTLVFRQVVPWDGNAVGGLPMKGVVRVMAEAKLVSFADGARRSLCAASTEGFSADIGRH